MWGVCRRCETSSKTTVRDRHLMACLWAEYSHKYIMYILYVYTHIIHASIIMIWLCMFMVSLERVLMDGVGSDGEGGSHPVLMSIMLTLCVKCFQLLSLLLLMMDFSCLLFFQTKVTDNPYYVWFMTQATALNKRKTYQRQSVLCCFVLTWLCSMLSLFVGFAQTVYSLQLLISILHQALVV